MERDEAGASVHDRLLGAMERVAAVQETSYALIQQQHALIATVRESVAAVRRRRNDRAARWGGAFGNGHRDAEGRSPPG